MRVHWFATVRTEMFLVEIGAERFLEAHEHRTHFFLCAFGYQTRDPQQGFVRLQLRPRREIFLHDLPLVKVADLDGNTLENAWNTAPSVQNDRLDHVPKRFDLLSQENVFELGLVSQLRAIEVLTFVRIARHQDTVLAAEERRVGDENDWTRTVHLLGHLGSIEQLCDGRKRKIKFTSELYLCLFSSHV